MDIKENTENQSGGITNQTQDVRRLVTRPHEPDLMPLAVTIGIIILVGFAIYSKYQNLPKQQYDRSVTKTIAETHINSNVFPEFAQHPSGTYAIYYANGNNPGVKRTFSRPVQADYFNSHDQDFGYVLYVQYLPWGDEGWGESELKYDKVTPKDPFFQKKRMLTVYKARVLVIDANDKKVIGQHVFYPQPVESNIIIRDEDKDEVIVYRAGKDVGIVEWFESMYK